MRPGKIPCPSCGATDWSCLSNCAGCEKRMCDKCPGGSMTGHDWWPTLHCAECRGPLALQPITARVAEADIPEWKDETCPI